MSNKHFFVEEGIHELCNFYSPDNKPRTKTTIPTLRNAFERPNPPFSLV